MVDDRGETRKMKLIIIGPQGSGKGVQSRKLSEHFHIPAISAGNLLREEILNKTALGITVSEYVNSGQLVPDEITVQLLKKRLKRNDCKNGFIIDAFPRTLSQGLALALSVDHVIFLDISDKEAITRIRSRVECEVNGRITTGLTKQECLARAGKPFYREDDTPEKLAVRLQLHHKNINPILEHYKKQGTLRRVNAEQTPERVFEEILKKVLSNK